MSAALNALAGRTASKPGSAWRVAITPLATAHAFQDSGLGSSFAKLNARVAGEKGKVKPAVMQVSYLGGEPCLTLPAAAYGNMPEDLAAPLLIMHSRHRDPSGHCHGCKGPH